MQFSETLSEILRKIDFIEVARHLGLTIGKREAHYTTALCPFHDDKKPSLALYREVGNPHYYCFACGARGGALDLVEKQRRESRADSLRWLAQEAGVELSENIRRSRVGLSDIESATFSDWLRKHHDQALLKNFAEQRRIDLDILVGANAFAVDMDDLVIGDLSPGEREVMEHAGVLIARRDRLISLVRRKQIVFPVESGLGYIFRAFDLGDDSSKSQRYRFSKGFRKAEVLYGLGTAQQHISSEIPSKGVFLVEGLMDVLRLRSIDITAVALLGTSISRQQAKQLQDLCTPKLTPVVPIHLFLDGDDAGRRAAPAAIRVLMNVDVPVPLDIIYPNQDGDPDELLAGLSQVTANDLLSSWGRSVLAVLAHQYSGLPVDTVLTDLPSARPLLRVETLRYIAAQLAGRWLRIRDLADPGAVYLTGAPEANVGWLYDALDRAEGVRPSRNVPLGEIYQPIAESLTSFSDSEVQLRRAIRIAQSSNFRREYPFDWGGMTRLALAANATSIAASELLADPHRRPMPYPARLVPKDSGRMRLKAGPWPEDALNQQYVLSELLRARPDTPGWYLEFPAVRLVRTSGPNPIITGPSWLRPVGRPGEPPPVVSFAYQIDQEIVEGDAPPRREGMFVPYRECWQQFLNHLDGFVARQPITTDTFFAVRLDISGFFDNLPRYAVEEVLELAIAEAAQRHFSGHDFAAEVASLLQPQEKIISEPNNRARAGLVARWLSDQSFGYRYFEPAKGNVVQTNNSTIGIPQGPDLSAFLANLALYPIDRAVTEEIEADRESRTRDADRPADEAAIYGRYVDDMVIITTSQDLLGRIEAIIGRELRARDLSMNAKHERTKALDRRKIREWLLGERGAAVLVSAGGEETPTTSRAGVEELLDVGPDTARSQVLQLLHHDDLYNPRWAETIKRSGMIDAVLERLRSYASVNLRYYDWVSAARWVMHSVVSQAAPDASGSDVAAELIKRWRNIYGQEDVIETFGEAAQVRDARQQYLDLTSALAVLDALERSLDSRHDRVGRIDVETRQALKQSRLKLCHLVHEQDLLGELNRILRDDSRIASSIHRINSMIRIQELGIRGLARSALSNASDGLAVQFAADGSYVERRFALNALGASIRSYAASVLHPPRASKENADSPEAEPLLGLHEALARLMATNAGSGTDPLEPIQNTIRQWSNALTSSNTSEADRGLKPALVVTAMVDQFLPNPGGDLNIVQPTAALRAFVEVIAGVPEGSLLLATRRHLVDTLAEDIEILAVPPGIDACGFLACDGDALKAFAFLRDNEQPDPDDIVFGVNAENNTVTGLLAEFSCTEPDGLRVSKPIQQKIDPSSVTSTDLVYFARAYRDLVDEQLYRSNIVDGVMAPYPVTPFHLLEPVSPDGKWSFFGAKARLPVGAQAFVRLGEDRLHSVAIYSNGAHLWQIGFALADNLGYRGFARSSELDRLTAAMLEPTDTAASIPFYVMQLTVPRLCGAYLGRSRFSIDPAGKLPIAIERQLTRLESIKDGEENTASNLVQLIEAGAEARAAELLREAPGPLQTAGTLSAIFRSLGRAAGRHERIFTQNLPKAVNASATHRRTVDLWLAAASRFDGLVPSSATSGTRSIAAALRIVGVAKLAQALTLEVWSLLSDEDWHRIANFSPNLDELDLPDEALLIASSQMQRSSPAADQIIRLISTLRTHAAPGATARSALDQITPLGWIVALATVTGLLDLEELPGNEGEDVLRPRLLAPREGNPASEQVKAAERRLWELLTYLSGYLALSATDATADEVHGPEWPWPPFQALVQEANNAVTWMTETMHLVEHLYGLKASTQNGRLFQIADADDRGYCLVLREGSRQDIAGWQIDRDSLGITRPGDIETRADMSGDMSFVWSEVTKKGRLVGLSLGYRSLADLAGLDFQITDEKVLSKDPRDQPIALIPTPPDQDSKGKSDTDPRVGQSELDDNSSGYDSFEASNIDVVATKPASPRVGASDDARSYKGSSVGELSRRWHAARDENKGSRNDVRPVTVRIALLQMNIDHIGHSFYHPICEVSGEPFPKWESFLKAMRGSSRIVVKDSSLFEAWRRAILTEALQRCRTLRVELLILPEYSTRPETIAWLTENLDQLAPETSILAGTFRHAARAASLNYATGTDRLTSLGALVPLIVPGSALETQGGPRRNAVVYSRLKKYPSTGLSELIRPEDKELRAVYDYSTSPAPVPESIRYIRDLICSEVFLAMSPANIFSCVPALMDLHRRFGNLKASDDVLKEVMQDITRIALDTSPAIRRKLANPRKTIIAVPAATTRAFDHHIFGEAGAKAAGLTTIFSNMAGRGRGESCFIGHYKSSSVEGSHVWGLQSPYHGRAPGIWTYHYEGGAPLGPDETALVVADVNPIDTNISKPARQLESLPISLVAHIPFFLEAGPNAKDIVSRLDIVANAILSLATTVVPSAIRSSCETDLDTAKEVKRLAVELADVDQRCHASLLFRAEGARVFTMQPHIHPESPLLTDWAFIPKPLEPCVIEVPEVDADDLVNMVEPE